MKQYKIEIIEQLKKEADGCRIVSLREVCKSMGIKHLKTQECLEIKSKFLKDYDGYKAVRIMNTKNDSIFTSLCFVDKTLSFEDM